MPENISGNETPQVTPPPAAPASTEAPAAPVKKPASKRKYIFILLGLLALGALIYWRIISDKFVYAGTVEATEVDVDSQLASNVTSLQVDEGQAVTQGQLLVTLDGPDYKIAQEQANDDYNRGLKLYQSGSMPKETFNHLKVQKELSDLHVQWCLVTSPLTATILTKYHEPGDWVGPGTKLFTLADLNEVWCYFYVPQPILAKLSYGQKVTATLPELKGKIFDGVISHINEEAEFTPKNVQTEKERTNLVYAIKIIFKNSGSLLKPGMTLEADLPKE
ncbi:MAG TPA: efflux RND transporter periplasmic adaptor subunit [bacterium]|jgi:HlyD family secretion protein|nr:efflux RND transporter periplasmic adaptor subunit [bacterium]